WMKGMIARSCDILVSVPPSLRTPRSKPKVRPQEKRPPGPRGRRRSGNRASDELDGLADGVEDAADLGAHEDQRDDRDDRDECEDQRVLGEALAFVVAAERSEDRRDECHLWLPL